MAAKTSTNEKEQGPDEVAPIEEQLSDNNEEKVISVRIPKKDGDSVKSKDSDDNDSEKKEETKSKEEEPVTKKEVETKTDSTPEPPKDTTDQPVTSFSSLDIKKDEPKAKESKTDDLADNKANEPDSDDSGNSITADSKEEESKDTKQEIKKWLEDSDTESEPEEEKSNKLKYFVFLLIFVIVLGALGGGFYYYQTQIGNESEESGVMVEPTVSLPTSTPEPTEEPGAEVNLSGYTVQVLNGTGTPGEAGEVAALLEDEGFSTPDTANADSYDFEETLVSMKEDLPEAVYDAIDNALGSLYVVALSDELDEDSEYDVVVTFGSLGPDDEEDVNQTDQEESTAEEDAEE